jgi:hypothetical protein
MLMIPILTMIGIRRVFHDSLKICEVDTFDISIDLIRNALPSTNTLVGGIDGAYSGL